MLTDNLLSKFSIISIVISICAIIRTNIYYSLFDIDISSFIDLSEFTSLFINEIFIFVLFLVIPFLYVVYAKIYSRIQQESRQNYNFGIRVCFILIAFVFGCKIIDLSSDFVLNYYEIVCCFVIIITGVLILFNTFDGHKSQKKIWVISSLFLFINSIINPWVDAQHLKANENKYMIEIIFSDGKKLVTDNNLLFLGRTKSFIFLYSKNEHKSMIYNNDNINLFSVKEVSLK